MTSITDQGGKRPHVTTSIDNGRGGRKRIRIYLPAKWSEDKQRVSVSHIYELSQAYDEQRPFNERTKKWLESLDDDMHNRISAKGLCDERSAIEIQRLETFLEWVLEQTKIGSDGKPIAETTQQVYRRAAVNLVAFFKRTKRIDSIKPYDARAFRNWLLTEGNRTTKQGLKESTANGRCKKAREWFAIAKDNGWIDDNPFACLQGLDDSPARRPDQIVYVAASTVEQLIDDAVDNEWRLLLALWRYAGLRQIEPLELKLTHISWESERMTVLAPKNKRYAHKYERVIPIWPEVRPFLLRQCEDAQEAGSNWLIFKRRYRYDTHKGTTARATNSTIRKRLSDQMLRLGIPKWPDMFRALRSSAETDRINQRDDHGDLVFTSGQIAYWWNHSEKTQRKHYYTVDDSAYEKAIERAEVESKSTAQKNSRSLSG